jgi:hypothetical protein
MWVIMLSAALSAAALSPQAPQTGSATGDDPLLAKYQAATIEWRKCVVPVAETLSTLPDAADIIASAAFGRCRSYEDAVLAESANYWGTRNVSSPFDEANKNLVGLKQDMRELAIAKVLYARLAAKSQSKR